MFPNNADMPRGTSTWNKLLCEKKKNQFLFKKLVKEYCYNADGF